MDEMIANAFAALAGPRQPLLGAPVGTGIFAIHGDTDSWVHLGLGRAPANATLLVGRTEDLEPLRSGRTGQSHARRTFAALLRDHLELRGIPRNQTKPERLADYTLSDEHDALLTGWMTEHLTATVWTPPEPAVLADIEVAVLKRWSPPLNMRDARSTVGAKVTAARKAMAGDARTWARERGHKL
ncbi:hypothetical protein BH11MYX3_BH11MYX3_31150 [soil metagenome]